MAAATLLNEHGKPLSQLDQAINALNIAGEEMPVATVKATLDSANVLLKAVRTSMPDKPSYVELALAYARLCETVIKSVNRRQITALSPSALDVIERLTKNAVEIYKYISQPGKRNRLSRIFGIDKDKKMFDAWWPDLMKISNGVNVEFGLGAPAMDSDTTRDVTAAPPITVNTDPDSLKTESTESKSPSEVASTPVTEQSTNPEGKKTHAKPDTPPTDHLPGNPNITTRAEDTKGPASVEDRNAQPSKPNRPMSGPQYPFAEGSGMPKPMGQVGGMFPPEGLGMPRTMGKPGGMFPAEGFGMPRTMGGPGGMFPTEGFGMPKTMGKPGGMFPANGFGMPTTMGGLGGMFPAEGFGMPKTTGKPGGLFPANGFGMLTTMGKPGGMFPPAAPPHSDSTNGKSRMANDQSTGNGDLNSKVAELRKMVEGWTQARLVRAASGQDDPNDKRAYEAAKNYLATMENLNKGSATDFDVLEMQKAQDECMRLFGADTDEQTDRAILESLAIAEAVEEEDESLPDEVLLRLDNRPVVVRTPDAKFAHIGQLWQALHYVPQIRHQVSRYRKPSTHEGVADVDLPPDTEEQVLSVHEMFSFMEQSGLGVITGEPSIDKFPQRPWAGISPGDDVADAYNDFSRRLEVCLNNGIATRDPDWTRVFHLRIDNVVSGLREQTAFDEKNDVSMLSIQYNDENGTNDLVGCLARQVFFKSSGRGSPSADRATAGERAITELAEVIAFAPTREIQQGGGNGKSRERRPFSFPESLYLDQFLVPGQGSAQDAGAAEEVEDQPRSESPGSLQKGPQKEKYTLRAVLMHDGQRGRKHVYSYINHDDAWWKIVDYTVTQVTLEAVMNDTTGMYLDAGPFFLIYSRSLSEPLVCEWPEESEIPCIPNPVSPDSESLYAD